ncbi:histidine phosphatase family protein [Gordonia soli]|uniref:Putative phosphatase n=1 Tax=Gordonia soli NBRC 108243 TaxID=1223545 RepID=M0QP79_9ACTN|nr:histidine phosphatase family protein [Gordonia soli]GAC70460.1 putative phosphatase [Gordonia soli NBRC 108243]
MAARADRRIVLIRHGQTEWSATDRHTGRTDIDLTTVGEEQAAALAPTIASLGLADPYVICSPRHRTQRTAQLAGLTVDETSDLFAEWDYGDYEGLTRVEIHERHDPDWLVWTGGGPGGESVQAMSDRVDRAVAHVLAASDGDLVVVSHGHFSRAFIARFLGTPIGFGAHIAFAAAGYAVLDEVDGHRLRRLAE